MERDPKPADAAPAMTTLLRHQRAGRFGRAVPTEGVETDEARTAMTRGEERSQYAGYEVDADAVAEAIVARLLAGRTLAPPRDARER
jgi:hypothetical protein